MSVKITQFTSTNTNQQERTSGVPSAGLLTGAGAGAALGYFALPGQFSAQELLKKYSGEKADKFISRIKGFENLTPEQKVKLDCIKGALSHTSKEYEAIEKAVINIFKKPCQVTMRDLAAEIIRTAKSVNPAKNQSLMAATMTGGKIRNLMLRLVYIGSSVSLLVFHQSLGLLGFGSWLGSVFFNKRYPNIILGNLVDTLAMGEKGSAAGIINHIKKSKANKPVVSFFGKIKAHFSHMFYLNNTANSITNKADKTFYGIIHSKLAAYKHSEKITEETATSMVKEAKEAADRTLIKAMEENMQGVEKYLPKHGLRNAGIGALLGAFVLGSFFAGKAKSREDKSA